MSHFQQLNSSITLPLFSAFYSIAVRRPLIIQPLQSDNLFPVHLNFIIFRLIKMSIVWWLCEEQLKTYCLPFKFFSQTWQKNRLYPPTGTLTSFLTFSLSPSLFFPFLGLIFQPEFNFLSLCSSSTLIVPGPAAIRAKTHTHTHGEKKPRDTVAGSQPPGMKETQVNPLSVSCHLEWSKLRSQSTTKKSAIVHLQDRGHEQILYLTHFPPFHKRLSVPLTLYSSV